MADHSKPLTTSTYANFVTELDGRFDDLTLGLDPATTSPTNLATNAIRFSSAVSKWQKYDGTTWADLASSYAININGTVGATTPAAGSFTDLSSTGNTTLGNASGDTVTITGTIQPGVVVSGSSSTDMFRITQTGTGNAFVVEDSANPDASPFVINTDGNVGIGTTSPDGTLEVSGTATTAYITKYASETASTPLVIRKSRGTEASPIVISAGDNLGSINFEGYDGANFSSAVQILAQSDGTPGSADMPGRLLLRTTPDGSASVATAVTINSSQVTNFTNGIQVNAINAYALKGISYLSGSGTYTTPSKVRAIYVECVGGGGGGGGVDGQGAGTAAVSRSGGGGAYCAKLITSPAATYTYAVGAGGSAGAAGDNDGTAGSATTFTGTGTSLSAVGGNQGLGHSGTAGNSGSLPGGQAGTATGGDINLAGNRGGARAILSGIIAAVSQQGDCPMFGGARAQQPENAGVAGLNFGCAGSGAATAGVTTNFAGGAGAAGTIRITEYY